MTDLEDILKVNNPEEAIVLLNSFIATHPDNAEALFQRGKLHWRLGHRSLATSDYAAASLIDPDSPAAMALENARDIEDFFNPDLLNP
ncbi:MAG: hypothetical protein NC111_04940 [Bacteroides sp.]|nr:hypothetical protein [Bacteroides sp.]MCM1413673.1 hypothetical protein [Bacteroides sp.]MCM1471852.1 hypothetical protein [Bacteroides sp.]